MFERIEQKQRKPRIYELQDCEQQRTDCFAYKGKKCLALNDTHFERQCPFYKVKRGKRNEDK